MTDVVSPSPKNNRRLMLIVAAIAVIVIALIVGLLLYASSAAGSKATDYEHDFAAWKAKDKAVLLAATDALPAGTYLSKGDVTTAKALAKQKTGCDAVAAAHKKLASAAGRLPTMGGNGLLGKLSSDYSDASDTSDRRAKAVRAYVKSASAALDQLERDCRWNIDFNTAAVKPGKLWSSAGKYSLEPGDTEPGGIFCPKGKDGCVSSITKKKNTYADLRIKAVKRYQARAAKFYGGKECKTTSYGSACAELLKASTAYQKLQLKNYEYIRSMKSSVNNPKLTDHNKALHKLYDRNLPKIRRAVLALDPGLTKDKRIRKSPDWTDHFFARIGKLLLADLKDERAAIDKL